MSGNIKYDKWINDDNTENYKCRAWVNFNGVGTISIRAAGNVSSLTDVATGNYVVNMTSALVDSNGVALVTSGDIVSHTARNYMATGGMASSSTCYVSIYMDSTGSAEADIINVAIFR